MKNITAVTVSMNRTEHLKKCIEAVAKIKNVSNHIIIDYSSKEPIYIHEDNVEVFRVDNEKFWWITRAYNAGFSLIKTDYILKIDADVIIDHSYFNNLKYFNYDHVLFTNNKNDAGNFLVKKDLLNGVNGFNEFIVRGYDDHDLLNRIKNNNPKLSYKVVMNKIVKLDHLDEKRVSSSNSILFKKGVNYYYALVKAYNDYNGYISSKNYWSNKKQKIYILDGNILKICHNFYINELKIFDLYKCKWIFLKTFFNIYFLNQDNILKKIFKKILPIIFIFIHVSLIKILTGFEIFPSKKYYKFSSQNNK